MKLKFWKCSKCEELKHLLKREEEFNDILAKIAVRENDQDNAVINILASMIEKQKEEIEKLKIQMNLMGGRVL